MAKRVKAKARAEAVSGADTAVCVCCGREVRRVSAGGTMMVTRGVCSACRGAMRRLVASGRTTWAELERAGLVLPVDHSGERMRCILERLDGARGRAGKAADGMRAK